MALEEKSVAWRASVRGKLGCTMPVMKGRGGEYAWNTRMKQHVFKTEKDVSSLVLCFYKIQKENCKTTW